MTEQSFVSAGSVIVAAGLTGVALGLCYFAMLRRTANAYTARTGWRAPIALTLMRLIGAAAVFALMARFGALALLTSFLGFLLARSIALSRSRRVA